MTNEEKQLFLGKIKRLLKKEPNAVGVSDEIETKLIKKEEKKDEKNT